MSDLPLVTIITPSYNQGRFIESTILSVLNQTYPNIEYIVVDGGSTDETMAVVAGYRDRIDVIIHEKDRGQSDAINKGFRIAKGELVGWINSDDTLYPDCVERIVELYRRRPDGAIYYGSVNTWIDAHGEAIGERNLLIPNRNFLLHKNFDIIQQGSFYPTEYVRRAGYLNEAIHYCMDLDLWLRLLRFGPIHALGGDPIATFRKWEATKTTTGGAKFLVDIRRVLLRHGASKWSQNIRRTYYWSFKLLIKRALFQ